MKKWLINPQRFDRYSYALNNPLRYTDPTGLSTLVCCDPNCNQLCENDDAQNSNPGGTEGSPQYSTDPPDDEEDEEDDPGDKNEGAVDCSECDCMNDPDIKKLVKAKRDLSRLSLGLGLTYSALCTLIGGLGGLICVALAPLCAALIAIACSSIFAAIIHENQNVEEKHIEQMMIDADCACAVYCG